MKRAHEAAAYDAWLRKQVRASIDDPRPSTSADEARTHMAARRQALLKTAGTKPQARPQLGPLVEPRRARAAVAADGAR
jgi:hypothetical protein